ncbi:MAG TPA: carboxylating nicotinate-nucleotide diphosphorylase [Xanthomonadales bacterium]|nr:carboxylating nicotinate-nucleotide diphosphorylase [Xanthomonadales bacterium]
MHPSTEDLISLALQEDLAFGDLTSSAIFPPGHRSSARILARQELVLCGIQVAQRVFERIDPTLKIQQLASDGQQLKNGHAVLLIEGSTIALLSAERTALNFLQRLCGIATGSRRFADLAQAHSKTIRIADTRKTTPGWRALEKYAVRCGGCSNHRLSLGEHVMIKDNHVAAAGSIRKAVTAARTAAPHLCRIEVEADTLQQVDAAVAAGADVILLDNMRPTQIQAAVKRIAGRALVEVSGGVGLHNLGDYLLPGVDVISIGALTHSATAADLSMDIIARPQTTQPTRQTARKPGRK